MKFYLILALTLFSSIEAFASSCVCIRENHPSAEMIKAERAQAFEKATAVFTGKVIDLNGSKIIFKVGKLWKGEALSEVVMSTGAVEGPDGTYLNLGCYYVFNRGEEYLVYAYGAPAKMTTDICTRTTLLKYAADEEKELDEIKPHETIGQRSKVQGAGETVVFRNFKIEVSHEGAKKEFRFSVENYDAVFAEIMQRSHDYAKRT